MSGLRDFTLGRGECLLKVCHSEPSGAEGEDERGIRFLISTACFRKEKRPFVEIRECRLILLLELPCAAEGKNIRQKNGNDSQSGNQKLPVWGGHSCPPMLIYS
jgi:hypothetical protein